MPTVFYLNDSLVRAAASPGVLALDYIRHECSLTGTKEGCKEGDCGACTVLMGEREGDTVRYQPVTSCTLPLGELHGRHVVTVEGLNLPDALSPVQSAIVDEGATQCGYCTPGFVVSLTALLLDATKTLSDDNVKYAIGGNLCRCTGYRSLKAAGARIREGVESKLTPDRVASLVNAGAIPAYFATMARKLAAIESPASPAPARTPAPSGTAPPPLLLAGGTDLYIQRGDRIPDQDVVILNRLPGMRTIEERDGRIHAGALVTFEQFMQSAQLRKIMPALHDYGLLMASWPIRNRATLSGNILNASPIADMVSLLLVLDSELTFRSGSAKRSVPLRSFYTGYKTYDMRPGEILEAVSFPVPAPGTLFHWEKVSKRRTLDIATVNTGIRMRMNGGVIEDAAVSLGGVAPVPLYLEETSRFLTGREPSVETVLAAIDRAQAECAPISDVRGSAGYKRLLVRQLILAHFLTLFPEELTMERFYEAS